MSRQDVSEIFCRSGRMVRLWLRLKADFFADWIARSGTELEDRLCLALNHFMTHSSQTASICSIRK